MGGTPKGGTDWDSSWVTSRRARERGEAKGGIMNGTGSLRLRFFDVHGDRAKDNVNIFLGHTVLSHRWEKLRFRATRTLTVKDLKATHGRSYRLMVYPNLYRPVSRFVQIREGRITPADIYLPAQPSRVVRILAPDYDELSPGLREVLKASNRVEGLEEKSGADLYGALDDTRKAGLLNIAAKMEATRFANDRTTLSYLHSLTRLRGDRFFADVEKELRDETINSISSGLFKNVSGTLHTPPPGYERSGSFKTFNHYGNLQLTFFVKPQTLEFRVDADIDDARGIEHVFQVVRNVFTGGTDPYDIHQILLLHQKIDPGYRLELA